MKRETFIAILGAALAEADAALLSEAKGLVFWRERELRSELVRAYTPGQIVEWQEPAAPIPAVSVIDHLNQFSLSIKLGGGQMKAVPIEWVHGLAARIEGVKLVGPGVTAEAIADQHVRYARRTP